MLHTPCHNEVLERMKCQSAEGVAVWRRYLEGKARLLYPEPEDVFPCDLIDADHCRPPTSYL